MLLNTNYRYRIFHIAATIGAVLAWTAVILQFVLILQNREASVAETVIRFFSFYTILTNIIVACCFTASAVNRLADKTTFFTKSGVMAATVVYIIIVGGIYNLVLRDLWAPTGLQRLVDELLHTINPLFYVFFWLLIADKTGLNWGSIFRWLLYPLGYFIVILIRGTLSGYYPYPFINGTELGWTQVIINSIFITGAFIILSLFVVFVSKKIR